MDIVLKLIKDYNDNINGLILVFNCLTKKWIEKLGQFDSTILIILCFKFNIKTLDILTLKTVKLIILVVVQYLTI